VTQAPEKKVRFERGTKEWWTALIIEEAAKRYRRQHHLPNMTSVEIDQASLDAITDEWNRKPLKRLWLLISQGAVTKLDAGDEVILKYKSRGGGKGS
jgi:hypothetical protein